MHLILYHSQSAHTLNKTPMGKTISFELSCRLDWIFVGIFFACKNPVFAQTQRKGTHSNQTNGNFTLFFFSSLDCCMWLAIASNVCVWVNGASYFSSRARYFARFFFIDYRSFGVREATKIQVFCLRYCCCFFRVHFYKCFKQFYNSNCYFSTHTY